MESGPSPLISTAPRPHPARLRLDTYPDRHLIDARYGDMDGNGHLNNVALETLHENTRANLNRRTFPGVYDRATRKLRIVAATNVVHFLNEAHWPARIEAAVGIGRVGSTSFVVATALFVDDVCISLCDTVLVMLGDHGPTPIPDDSRSTLTSLLLRTD